jgi:hypothetical protein
MSYVLNIGLDLGRMIYCSKMILVFLGNIRIDCKEDKDWIAIYIVACLW